MPPGLSPLATNLLYSSGYLTWQWDPVPTKMEMWGNKSYVSLLKLIIRLQKSTTEPFAHLTGCTVCTKPLVHCSHRCPVFHYTVACHRNHSHYSLRTRQALHVTYHNSSSVEPYIDGILPKWPYLPCLRMADKALLTGYPWYPITVPVDSATDIPSARSMPVHRVILEMVIQVADMLVHFMSSTTYLNHTIQTIKIRFSNIFYVSQSLCYRSADVTINCRWLLMTSLID